MRAATRLLLQLGLTFGAGVSLTACRDQIVQTAYRTSEESAGGGSTGGSSPLDCSDAVPSDDLPQGAVVGTASLRRQAPSP